MLLAKFKLKPVKVSESALKKQIADYLSLELARNRIVWFARCNGGGMFNKAKQWIWFYRLFLRNRDPASKGMADLHGQMPDGRYFALEVKAHGEVPTPEQLIFLDTVRIGKGIAAVVYSYADVKNVLFDEFDSSR